MLNWSKEEGTMDKELTALVEGILNSSTDEETVKLWNQISAEFSIAEVVWAHSKVSVPLVDALVRMN
jgi:hypothetical protein